MCHERGCVQMYSPDGHFRYGSNVDGFSTDEPNQNVLAGYWFGITYVLFYLRHVKLQEPCHACQICMLSLVACKDSFNMGPSIHYVLMVLQFSQPDHKTAAAIRQPTYRQKHAVTP